MRAGAVLGSGADAGVAWHYGDPFAEQRALAEGAAWVDHSHRGVITITGADRLSWLHSLTTQDLANLPPGVSTESLILSPHGHIEHALHIVDDGATTWITTEPGSAEPVVAWLDRMRFMLRVEVADVSADWAVVAGLSGLGDRGPDGEGPPVWLDPWPHLGPDSASYSAVSEADHPGHLRPWVETLVPRAQLDQILAQLPLAGTWASEALRVAAWRPRAGVDSDHRTIPHELDWLRTAVHLQKGCYRGQETVARVHNLGRPPRRLVLLHLDGSEHVLPGRLAPVLLDDRALGVVTTPVRHHELGPTALAVIKRSTPPGATLRVDATSGEGGAAHAEGGGGEPVWLAAAQEVVVAP